MNAASGLGRYSNLGCNIYWYSMQKGGIYYIPCVLTVYFPITRSMNPEIVRRHLLHKINVILEHWTSTSLSSPCECNLGVCIVLSQVFPLRGQASRVM